MKKQSVTEKPNYLLIAPLMLLAAVLPLIVRMYYFENHLTDQSWFGASDHSSDFYLHGKVVFFLIICAACIIIWIIDAVKNEKVLFTKAFLPLFLYGLLTLISSILSEYSWFSFHGIIDQFESVWVVLGYCLICYYAFCAIRTGADLKPIFYAFCFSSLIQGIVCFSQQFGHTLLNSGFALALIIPGSLKDMVSSIDLSRSSSPVFGTLYNANYVGVMGTLMIPVLITGIFCLKKKPVKLLLCCLTLFDLMAVLFSSSKSFLLASAMTFVLAIIFTRRELLAHIRIAVISLLILLAAGICFMHFSPGLFSSLISAFKNASQEDSYPLQSITYDDSGVSIKYNDSIFHFAAESSEDSVTFYFTDENGSELDFSYDEDDFLYSIEDSRFPNFSVQLVSAEIDGTSQYLYKLTTDDHYWYFSNLTGDGTWHYYTLSLKEDEIITAENVFPNHSGFFSGRGYIWGTTIPLLKNSLLLGTGADTFALVYPQNAYVDLANTGFSGQYVSKPHNLYLQIAILSGIPALICLLVFYLIYFINSCRLYFRADYSVPLTRCGLGLFLATFAYMFAGIANDSTVCVAPVFWAILGCGMAVNRLVKQHTDTAVR